MTLTATERRQLKRSCSLVLPDFRTAAPAAEFARLAAWCEANGVEHDDYGEGELVGGFEQKLAGLLGMPAAVFMPSGIMAQLTAVRLWTEAARLPRFGMHPTSHLLHHESEAYEALLHCHGVPVGHRLRPMTAADLEAVRQPLACAIVELPIREAGGQLPSWAELEALKAAARSRDVRLHMDGARLWESAAFYGRSHAEIAAGFDSVYVSVYKGIGAPAGAVLLGDAGFIDAARLWRRRFGGTLYHLSPMVAAAAMRFDERVALMPALYQRALGLAQALSGIAGLRLNPAVPQANLMHLHFDAPADAVNDARDRIAADSKVWLCNGARPADVPGWSFTELYVGDTLLETADDAVLPLFTRLVSALGAAR